MKRPTVKFKIWYRKYPPTETIGDPDLEKDFIAHNAIITTYSRNNLYSDSHTLKLDTLPKLRYGDVILDLSTNQYYVLSSFGWSLVTPK